MLVQGQTVSLRNLNKYVIISLLPFLSFLSSDVQTFCLLGKNRDMLETGELTDKENSTAFCHVSSHKKTPKNHMSTKLHRITPDITQCMHLSDNSNL